MAINFSKPALGDNYSTVFVPSIVDNTIALSQWLDSGLVTINGTPPIGAKKYNRTSSALEEWNGSAWVNMPLQGITYASARLGIGTTPVVSGANAMDLQVGNPTVSTGAGITLGATTTNDIAFADGVSGAAQYAGLIRYSHANDSLQAWTASTERWRTTGSGDFGLGTATPNKLAVSRALTVNGLLNSAFEVAAGDVSCGWLFGSPSRVTLETNGAIPFTVNVNGAEAYRVDTSRNLLVGTTTAAQRLTVNGSARVLGGNFELDTGMVTSNSGANPLLFGINNVARMSIDTSGLVTATVGFAGPGGGLTALNANNLASGTVPNARTTGTAAATANTLALRDANGDSAVRGLTLGNTAVAGANVLDWYEEGTWTPTYEGGTTAGTCTYTTQDARFVRIGRLVFVDVKADCASHTGTGRLRLRGLPYAAARSTEALTATPRASSVVAGSQVWTGEVTAGQTYVELIGHGVSTGGIGYRLVTDESGAHSFHIRGFYEV